MAIPRLKTKTASKGKAVAHSKYIMREDKYANRGKAKDEKLEHTSHGNMPSWAENPSHFWEMADKHERKGGKVYREHEVALPRELTSEQRIALVEDFVKEQLGDKFAYQYAIHNPIAMDKGEQPHLHLMFSERQLDGIERGADQFFKRYNPKNPEKGGCKKANTGFDTKLQSKEFVENIRQSWEKTCNKHLEMAGREERINMKSLIRQGIDRQPINFSMEEINDPIIKEIYQSSLLAERELEQAKEQLAEFAPTYTPQEIIKQSEITAVIEPQATPQPQTPTEPTTTPKPSKTIDFNAVRERKERQAQMILKGELKEIAQSKDLAPNHIAIAKHGADIHQQLREQGNKHLAEVTAKADTNTLSSGDIEKYRTAKRILNSVERLEQERTQAQEIKKQREVTAVTEPKPQPQTAVKPPSERLEPHLTPQATQAPPTPPKGEITPPSEPKKLNDRQQWAYDIARVQFAEKIKENPKLVDDIRQKILNTPLEKLPSRENPHAQGESDFNKAVQNHAKQLQQREIATLKAEIKQLHATKPVEPPPKKMLESKKSHDEKLSKYQSELSSHNRTIERKELDLANKERTSLATYMRYEHHQAVREKYPELAREHDNAQAWDKQIKQLEQDIKNLDKPQEQEQTRTQDKGKGR